MPTEHSLPCSKSTQFQMASPRSEGLKSDSQCSTLQIVNLVLWLAARFSDCTPGNCMAKMTETELTLSYIIWCSFFGIDTGKYFFLMSLFVFISSHVGSKNIGNIETDYLWTKRLIKLKQQLYGLRHYINGIHCQISKSYHPNLRILSKNQGVVNCPLRRLQNYRQYDLSLSHLTNSVLMSKLCSGPSSLNLNQQLTLHMTSHWPGNYITYMRIVNTIKCKNITLLKTRLLKIQ